MHLVHAVWPKGILFVCLMLMYLCADTSCSSTITLLALITKEFSLRLLIVVPVTCRFRCRIHFAGAETATVWCGFMNGAVQAGQRAAMEVTTASAVVVKLSLCQVTYPVVLCFAYRHFFVYHGLCGIHVLHGKTTAVM